MLYLLENTDVLKEDFVGQGISGLSLQRLKKLDRLKMPLDRINCVAAFLLLRYALKQEYHFTEMPEFEYGKHEKPYLKNAPHIFFNLSHCRNSCACILSDKETAVDISDIRRISMHTAAYFCSPEELEQVKSAPEPNRELIRIWTRKECFSKLDGSGISMNYRLQEAKGLTQVHTLEAERYFLSYCHEDPSLPVIRVDAASLLMN